MTQEATRSITRAHTFIIELAGVAGAGKSTLLKAMMQRDGKIKKFPPPSKISYLPWLIRLFSKWLPIYLKNYRNSRWFTLDEIKNMGYLDTWLSYIRIKTGIEQNVFVLDPGSVYWLSSLQALGPEITKHPDYRSWLGEKVKQWSSGLDAIIWLDAPTDVCLQRALSRDEWHEIKEMPIDRALHEVKSYRDCYEKMVPEMASRYSVKVFHFHTDQISTAQMVEQIFSDADLWGKFNRPFRNN